MRARTGIDLARLASAIQRPGSDPSVHLSWGIVGALGFDAAQGIFADVKLIPDGTIETCFVAAAYAGGAFGMWCPLRVDDMVLVALPNGDPNTGPVVISRIWNGADVPSDDFKNPTQDNGEDVPSDDFVIRIAPGKNYKLRVSDSTGDNATQGGIDVKVEGAGTFKVETAGSGAATFTASGAGLGRHHGGAVGHGQHRCAPVGQLRRHQCLFGQRRSEPRCREWRQQLEGDDSRLGYLEHVLAEEPDADQRHAK
jgi:hypothetical protein